MSKNTISASATGLPSRRNLLATAAAAPLAALPLAIPALAATIATDPIFAVMEACRRAKIDDDAAKKAFNALENENLTITFGFRFKATMAGETKAFGSHEALANWLDEKDPSRRDAGKREIGRLATQMFGVEMPPISMAAPEEVAQWSEERAAIWAAYEKGRSQYDEARKAAGLDEAEARWDDASDVFESAESSVFAVAPTTPTGGLALARFCAEYLAQNNGDFRNTEAVAAALLNATKAMSASAGGDLVISDALASVYVSALPSNETPPAEPKELLEAYHSWLFFEYRYLTQELYRSSATFVRPNNPGGNYHWVSFGDPAKPSPSTRAAAVLNAVGCNWRKPLSEI